MSSLSSFIIAESLKTRSIIALHRYDAIFKHEITKDLQRRLFTAWKQQAKSLALKVDKLAAESATFKNPKATIAVTVAEIPIKLYSSAESGRARVVSPSVKLPLLLSDPDHAIAKEAMLTAAVTQFTEITHAWAEVFMHELNSGQIKTDFEVKRDSRSVRLCLTAIDKHIEHETVLYHVAVEHGKLGSKVRDYDTIYLSVDR